MLISATTMRILLLLCLLGMQVIGAFYLRQRRLSFFGYLAWGLLAVTIPALGPFLVIILAPGQPAYRWGKRRPPGASGPGALPFDSYPFSLYTVCKSWRRRT